MCLVLIKCKVIRYPAYTSYGSGWLILLTFIKLMLQYMGNMMVRHELPFTMPAECLVESQHLVAYVCTSSVIVCVQPCVTGVIFYVVALIFCNFLLVLFYISSQL
jgi:hypothetical protein